MKIKTLLCIDPLQDYELIDCDLLLQLGIVPLFLINDVSKSVKDRKNVLVTSFSFEELFAICDSISPDYIVCFSEDMFVDIARIRENLNIAGMSFNTSMLLSHKDLMYQKLDGLFSYPKTTTLIESPNLKLIKEKVGVQEVFVKPINSSGSYETYHIKTEEEFCNFLTNKKESAENYIAQAYVANDLYHSELAVFEGNILFVEARKYTSPNHLMVSKNLPIFSLNILNAHQRQSIIDASIKVCQLLEFNNGVLHTEFFMNEDGHIQFIETNARPPGIGLNKLYQRKYSISLETILCCIVCGVEPPGFVENKSHFVCGYFPRKKGIIKKINKPQLSVQNEWTLFARPDDTSEQMVHMSKSAMVLCWDDSIIEINKTGCFLAEQDIVEVY
ncbi:ATP-grasp domain-containing protein [Legionella pneumophila]|uniref:Glutathione synthetase ATP-binding domain-like n=1 Tax=Legionella pneumophila subsp. pascullei TaxID=91890 RepID=A0AAX2IT26_LEGPN|nr:ATP-grasp domain-containing protein [Legionella pneumophila]AMP88316.1 glutathione synthetase [Legionella pneumophila subsp. pascullei]AMP91225.1 glutathione synthetase [Legionella pneumophila subsp. pascullei]AMP94212.1 glutathione synthetase [Legionella pneumophila subsp. pascullei]SQG88986.1 Putative Glutathione synthetase ATP-binding domain-like [Legionella pneumophila subsp. pascullei]VEH04036.1 Putative Glutathione synthetase ATP-binding domain-like [Legionella pneumophila subsp. pasc